MIQLKNIGNRIAAARKKVKLSQAQLAERISISPQAVGKWERGESMPDIVTFGKLAEILGVDLNYFSENFQSPDRKTPTNPSTTEQASGATTNEQKQSRQWDMSQGNWMDADFSGLKNLTDKFNGSNIQNCKFIDSNFTGLTLKSNNVTDCDFRGSTIIKSQFQNSNIVNNQFNDCSLNETEYAKSNIDRNNFSGADFTSVLFTSSSFLENTITGAVWNGTSFKESHISDVIFEGTLEDCSFENCAFHNVKFQNATLINTFFKNNKKLNRVEFIDCKVDDLTFAFLKNNKADLSNVSIMAM